MTATIVTATIVAVIPTIVIATIAPFNPPMSCPVTQVGGHQRHQCPGEGGNHRPSGMGN